MFDLDHAISEWRRQMLAAGIKTPVPLEELENHLRDDVEQQMQSGSDAQQAFEASVQRMGQANVLKAEFKKSKGFFDLLCDGKATKTDRVLAVLWMMQCLWICWMLRPFLFWAVFQLSANSLYIRFTVAVYLAGTLGCILLFRGDKRGRIIIRIIALLGLVAAVAQILSYWTLSTLAVALTFFNLVTIWLLHSPKVTNFKPNAAMK